eukprot:SAG31_NODE_18883_length_619_cov_1.165385_1_plen_60_part_10
MFCLLNYNVNTVVSWGEEQLVVRVPGIEAKLIDIVGAVTQGVERASMMLHSTVSVDGLAI